MLLTLRQNFATTLYADEVDAHAEIVFVPRSSSIWSIEGAGTESVLQSLQIQRLGEVSPEHLENALALIIASPLQLSEYLRTEDQSLVGGVDPQYRQFAEKLATDALVPIEESPLRKESLVALVKAAAKPMGMGAMIGAAVGVGGSPMLFVWIPGGIIVCYAARGIGRGLEGGLRRLVRKLMRRR